MNHLHNPFTSCCARCGKQSDEFGSYYEPVCTVTPREWLAKIAQRDEEQAGKARLVLESSLHPDVLLNDPLGAVGKVS